MGLNKSFPVTENTVINRLSITVNSFVGEKGAEYFNNEDIQHIYVEYNFLGKFKLWLSSL